MARRTTLRTAALALVAAVCLAGSPTSALAGTRVTRRGDCTGASAWSLKVRSIDDGRLRVRLLIAGGGADHDWNVFMDHNGEGFFAGSRTSADGGLVVVRRLVDDLDGADRIRAGALDTATGEECRARAVL